MPLKLTSRRRPACASLISCSKSGNVVGVWPLDEAPKRGDVELATGPDRPCLVNELEEALQLGRWIGMAE